MSEEAPATAGLAPPSSVALERLTLTDFRNYGHLELDLRPGPVVLTGDNGSGKTNLLEAISLLTPGRGLRRAPYEEVARQGAPSGFAVSTTLQGTMGEVAIGTGTLGLGPGESGRRVRINGAPARRAEDLLEWLRVLWLTPSMDTLFTGSAGERRRFLDRLVLAVDPAHAQRTIDYEKAMRHRNRLLADDVRDPIWFDALEAQLAETGVAIAAARAELVDMLQAMVDRAADTVFPKSDLRIAGDLDLDIRSVSAVDLETGLRERMAMGRDRDRAAGRMLDGPHRSDLRVEHRTKAMAAEFCSTGEQKALLVGIVMAHARLCADLAGQVPIVLLDEIAAHLDRHRRDALFALLGEIGCQAFMTGTDAALFAGLAGKAQFFTVDRGSVVETAPALTP